MKSIVEKMKNISNHLVSPNCLEKSSQVCGFGCVSWEEPRLMESWCPAIHHVVSAWGVPHPPALGAWLVVESLQFYRCL